MRTVINEIDNEILQQLKKRMELLPAIVKYKQIHNLAIQDPKREAELLEQRKALAQEYGLNPAFVEDLFEQIMAEARRVQEAMAKKN